MASVVLYYLLKNPSTLSTIRNEIDTAAREGRISRFVTWQESQTLVYLDACVKEASRLHPPIGFPMERIVPNSGLEVDGYSIPAGTRVSMVRVLINIISPAFELSPHLPVDCMLIPFFFFEEPLGCPPRNRLVWG